MEHPNEQKPRPGYDIDQPVQSQGGGQGEPMKEPGQPGGQNASSAQGAAVSHPAGEYPSAGGEGRPNQRARGVRGTAAMDPETRQEVARKGGLAVSRNKQHMAEIGRKGGQSVSKNREHMANIGRKGGAASRGHR